MTTDISVSEHVKHLIEEISRNYNLKPVTVKYQQGSQIGDGYGSKTIAAEIISEDTKPLHLFLKCALDINRDKIPADGIFANEIYFYEIILPIYTKFLQKNHIEDGLRNVPKFYASIHERKKEVIVLENLRELGYTLFNRYKVMNDAHIKLLLKTLAKFHSISFALKDQNADLHEKLCRNCYDISPLFKAMSIDKFMLDTINDFFEKLDPIEDKDILEKCGKFTTEMAESILNIESQVDEYSILTKGDCWSNNMMVLYNDELEENPIDIMLIDWQLIRKASPLHDIMNIYYTTISKEGIENTPQYMKYYYDELAKRIRELGSDPNICYPFEVFDKEWRKYSKFGLGSAIVVIKIMLTDKDETINFEAMSNGETFDNLEEIVPKLKKQDEYMDRIRYIARYLIKNGIF